MKTLHFTSLNQFQTINISTKKGFNYFILYLDSYIKDAMSKKLCEMLSLL